MQAHYIDDPKASPPTLLSAIDVETLQGQGIYYERLPLRAEDYQPHLDTLRQDRGYGTQDEIRLTPTTENLEAICKKFDDEHLHEEDEVRFVLAGEGIFDIRSDDERWMRVLVEAGDLIVVPKNKYHRFELTSSKAIHCVRLFQDPAGWVPHYR